MPDYKCGTIATKTFHVAPECTGRIITNSQTREGKKKGCIVLPANCMLMLLAV